MAFVSGPRQSGKTTASKQISDFYDVSRYFNWDEKKFRLSWKQNPIQALGEYNLNQKNLVILDEVHKNKLWKNDLKGLYDLKKDDYSLIVTGSARLDAFRKSGDSLVGRYFHFRLYPFSFNELKNKPKNNLFDVKKMIQNIESHQSQIQDKDLLQTLFEFGPFPEPYLKQSKQFSRMWRGQYAERLIKEDLRDLSGALELNQVETLAELLPTKVMSPLSVQSLQEDLGPAHSTITRWLKYLNLVYFFFEIRPYSKSIIRSLKKERKIYFFDWCLLENDAAKFENLLAFHLWKTCHYLTDTGEGTYELFYLRNKQKKEIDFLVVKDKKPQFTVEAKLNENQLDKTFEVFQNQIKVPHFQVIQKSGILKRYREYQHETHVISADQFLNHCI